MMNSNCSSDIQNLLLDDPNSLIDLMDESSYDVGSDTDEPTLFKESPYYYNSDFVNLLTDKSDVFSILSLNCQSIHAKFELLKSYIEMYNNHEHKLSAICLQETWLSADSDSSHLKLDGYNLIHRGKSCSAHGGVAIYLLENLQYEILTTNSNTNIWDSLFIKVSTNYGNISKKIILGNLYRPPRPTVENIQTFMNELEPVLNNLRNYKNVVIMGDFNLNLLAFQENSNINEFLEFMISNSYFPKITLPTRLTQRKGTLIDNIFVKVTENFNNSNSGVILNRISDHLPYFTILDYFSFSKSSQQHIKLSSYQMSSLNQFKADLQIELSNDKLENIVANTSNDSYSNFNNILQQLMNKNFPVRKKKFNKYKHRKSKWITKGIIRSILFKDKLYVKLKATPVESDLYEGRLLNFRTYARILKQSINLAKKQYYFGCFEKFKGDMKKTWTIINEVVNRKQAKKEFPDSFEIEGRRISNDKTIANEFNRYFIEIGPKLCQATEHTTVESYRDYLKKPLLPSFEFSPADVDDVRKAIDLLKPKTSTGLDKISNKLLKYVKWEISPILTKIFNQSIHQGVFPDILKQAKVIPLYKQKEDFLFCNYRPVSLLSSVSKVFERIMYNQIYTYLTQLKVFYKSQYGFRQFHSTELATLELIDRITYAMDTNHLPVNIYLDLSKAFDTLDHSILVFKLKYYGFKEKALDLMINYLNNRTQQVQYNDTLSDILVVKCGVPQGSILGPLLFLIYVNDITTTTKLFHPILYADDTTLCAALNHNWSLSDCSKLNEELKDICKWMKLNKLTLNIAKTKAMIFHTVQRNVTYPPLLIDNVAIEFVQNFNFLGIILNQHLKWGPHIEMIMKKVSKTTGVMKRIKNCLPTNALLNIYHALISPHLNYGVMIWGRNVGDILKMQKRVVRIITKSRYNAHTNQLFRRLRILKIQDLCALHDYKFCYRYEKRNLPEYFLSEMLQRNTHVHNLSARFEGTYRLPAVGHEYARYCISYLFPKISNEMDEDIKSKIYSLSLNEFKNYIKQLFFDSYDVECDDNDCPSCNNVG